MQNRATPTVWQKTKVQCLVRHVASGIYYARTRVRGKLLWKSLKTDVFRVAKARLAKTLIELGGGARSLPGAGSDIETVGQAAKVHLENVDRRVNIKPSTKHYWKQISAALFASWPLLADKKLTAVTSDDCKRWAHSFSKGASATRYNNTVDCLRAIFEVGITEGILFRNPAATLDKVRVPTRHLDLPSCEQFAALVKAIRSNGAWCSRQCGDLVEFLAYSGCRLGEAANVKWSDVHEAEGFFWVHGDPIESTKNSTSRMVPIIAPMARLLEDLRQNPRPIRDPKRRDDNYVLAITECQKAIDAACGKLGIPRLTHHGLRHLNATVAIESGVDVPTVAKFLGHRDGGSLAMRVYGHLRTDHLLAAAKKVQF